MYLPLSKFESIHRVYRYLYDGTGSGAAERASLNSAANFSVPLPIL